MGLVNTRNLRKAKELLEKNRHKVGDAVGKATEKIDKVSGGKTTNMSKKAEEAARKYSAGSSSTHHEAHPDAVGGTQSASGSNLTPEEIELRRAEAQIKAADALANFANLAGGLLGKAQQRIHAGDASGAPLAPPPPPSTSSDAEATASDAEATANPPPMPAPPPLPES